MICCPEEIALDHGWITPDKVAALGHQMSKTEYGQYLIELSRR